MNRSYAAPGSPLMISSQRACACSVASACFSATGESLVKVAQPDIRAATAINRHIVARFRPPRKTADSPRNAIPLIRTAPFNLCSFGTLPAATDAANHLHDAANLEQKLSDVT